MTQLMPALSVDGHTASAPREASRTTQSCESDIISNASSSRMGAKEVFLWTVQEGRILNNNIGRGRGAAALHSPNSCSSSPSGRGAVDLLLTRAASFSASEGVLHDRQALARGRSALYDKGQHLSARGGGDQRGAATRGKSSDAYARQAAVDDDDDGFPVLVRRSTFSDTTTTTTRPGVGHQRRRIYSHDSSSGSSGCGGDDSSGRVPMSVSEDNMLALLSKHPRNDPENHARVVISKGDCGANSSSSRVNSDAALKGRHCSRGGSTAVGSGDSSGSGAGAQAWRDPNDAAASRASRNKFVIRLHRAGLAEDASRCVMDIVEERAAGAGAGERGTRGVGREGRPLKTVTLDEVKAHFQSFPLRYTLSVEPEDALAHIGLVADASRPSSAVRVLVHPCNVQSELGPWDTRGSGGGGGRRRGGVAEKDEEGRYYAVTVVCRHSPRLLEAVLSSLRSAGGTCIDADVMTTSGGISMARLEVEADWRAEKSSANPPPWNHTSEGASDHATIHDAMDQMRDDQHAMSATEPSLQSRLEDLLSTGITDFLSTEDDPMGNLDLATLRAVGSCPYRSDALGASGAGDRCGSTASDSDDRPAPCKKAKATAESAFAGAPPATSSCPLETVCSQCPYSAGGGGGGGGGHDGGDGSGGDGASAPQRDQKERTALAAAACEQSRVAPPLAHAAPLVLHEGAGESRRSSTCGGACSAAVGDPRGSNGDVRDAGGAGGDAAASGCLRRQRVRLARRAGCGFLAEADASGSSGIPVSSGSNDDSDSNGGHCGVGSGGVGDDGGDGGAARNDSILPSEIELLELVGEGRFSRTHRARWRGEMVAVKTLELPAMGPHEVFFGGTEETCEAEPGERDYRKKAMMAEFHRELKIVRELNHPNICGYRGVCVAAPHLSLVFEFLDNGTLGDRLRNRRPQTIATPRSNLVSPASIGVDVGVSAGVDGSSTSSVNGGSAHHGNTCTSEQILKSCNGAGGCAGAGPCDAGAAVGGVGCALADAAQGPPPSPQQLQPADIFRIVEDVVAGMLYLHEVGVLHRDLKPDNILLDAHDRARIADFGLSRLCQSTQEHTAETGTYRWMAPEVIRHEPYKESADVYSFGVVLWEVLTRRQPFEGWTPIQAAFAVARQGLRPQLPHSAPPALAALIRRCWHATPDARPSFAQIRSELPEVKRQMRL